MSVIIPTQITSTEKTQGVPEVRTAWLVSQLLWQSQALHPQNALLFFSSTKGVKCEGQGAHGSASYWEAVETSLASVFLARVGMC